MILAIALTAVHSIPPDQKDLDDLIKDIFSLPPANTLVPSQEPQTPPKTTPAPIYPEPVQPSLYNNNDENEPNVSIYLSLSRKIFQIVCRFL